MASHTEINRYLAQRLMDENSDEIDLITAAKWLNDQGVLKDSLQRPGLPLRKLLRAGKINGAFQYPNRRWVIRHSKKETAYSVKEAAEELGLSEHAIYKRIERGLLKPEKLGPKTIVISKSELLRQQIEHQPAQHMEPGAPLHDQISSLKQQIVHLQSQLSQVSTKVDQLDRYALPVKGKKELGFRSIEDLKAQGFLGFISVYDYQKRNVNPIPEEKGLYMVLYTADQQPFFKKNNKAGRFLGQNPTVDREELERMWVKNTVVLYIGQAGGSNSSATLRSRIRQLVAFGNGRPISHWEGRTLWQIKDAAKLVLCWQTTSGHDPRVLEKKLIDSFISRYSAVPFANLKD